MIDKRPIAIYHKGDAEAFYASTPEEQAAWNKYAQDEADAFDNDPHRDSYDSTRVFVGINRDGKIVDWVPPLFFPEWLEKRRQRIIKMNKIFKYQAPINEKVHFIVPIGSKLLCFDFQNGVPTVWVSVPQPTTVESGGMIFQIVPTGGEEPKDIDWSYYKTCLDGLYVWHIYTKIGNEY